MDQRHIDEELANKTDLFLFVDPAPAMVACAEATGMVYTLHVYTPPKAALRYEQKPIPCPMGDKKEAHWPQPAPPAAEGKRQPEG